MFTIRTSKEIDCGGLHISDICKIEFRYEVTLISEESIKIKVDGYKILEDDNFELIPGSAFYKDISGDQLLQLMAEAENITPEIEGETKLEYFGRLVGSGIKIYVVSTQLYRNQLSLTDFE